VTNGVLKKPVIFVSRLAIVEEVFVDESVYVVPVTELSGESGRDIDLVDRRV